MRKERPESLGGKSIKLSFAENQAEEGFVNRFGCEMYQVPDYDAMPPFLMSIVSDSNHWMYVSSYGGLTMGRIDRNHSIFPYETDNKLHRRAGLTGPLTILRVRRGE